MSEIALEELVVEARSGSRQALEEVVRRVQDQVYSLCLRMLFHPADAEDASQEILIKLITNLQGFRFECPFRFWVMRIAANHLKAMRKNYAEKKIVSMEWAQSMIDRVEAIGWFSQPLEAPEPMMELEMFHACTQALLLALDRPHRLAFILGVVMEVTSQEGGYILDITPEAYRKRLSRARQRVTDFLRNYCGFFNEERPCSCGAVAAHHLKQGWLFQDKPLFVPSLDGLSDPASLRQCVRELDDLGKVSTMFKSFPITTSPYDFAQRVKDILGAGNFSIFNDPNLN